jgi:mRNA-degrading endonuclease RelE of RelBE toxin-antitoxin system
MHYSVFYSQEAISDLSSIRAYDRAQIIGEIDQLLQINPTLESKAKIKKLTQPALSAYRLRVGEYRVFYDVDEDAKEVTIIRILQKPQAVRVLTGAP